MPTMQGGTKLCILNLHLPITSVDLGLEYIELRMAVTNCYIQPEHL